MVPPGLEVAAARAPRDPEVPLDEVPEEEEEKQAVEAACHDPRRRALGRRMLSRTSRAPRNGDSRAHLSLVWLLMPLKGGLQAASDEEEEQVQGEDKGEAAARLAKEEAARRAEDGEPPVTRSGRRPTFPRSR